MSLYVVNANLVNLRVAPAIVPDNVIATLRRGQPVDAPGLSSDEWTKVTVNLSSQTVAGYVATRFLLAAPPPETLAAAAPAGSWQPPASTGGLSAAWFAPRKEAALSSNTHRHIPIGHPDRPVRDAPTAAQKSQQLLEIVRALDVEHSVRYGPDEKHTYCNIYATDFCWLARAYLPRVWWVEKAIQALGAGNAVAVDYAKTVEELNANRLYDWLSAWGDDFGWSREMDIGKVQQHANDGGVAVLCAKRRGAGSGHITVIVPEDGAHFAQRQGSTVLAPLQSQAGRKNRAWFSSPWWITLASNFQASGFWLHA